MEETIVFSLGGSLIVPHTIHTSFLRRFADIISNYLSKKRIIIICGGGRTARKYQKALQSISPKVDEKTLDNVGIAATYLNAILVKSIFGDSAEDEILKNPTQVLQTNKRLIIGCGWQAGFSTDMDAVLAAKTYQAHTIVNLSNVSYIYDADPKISPKARPIKNMHWEDLRALVGKEWKPGAHVPFDPSAIDAARRQNLRLVFLKGSALKNFERYLSGKKFRGTVVEG